MFSLFLDVLEDDGFVLWSPPSQPRHLHAVTSHICQHTNAKPPISVFANVLFLEFYCAGFLVNHVKIPTVVR